MHQGEQFLQKLKQVVLENLANEQFGVGHLSKSVALSRSHLHRRLKKLKGLSISQFIREIRLEEAMKLLHQDELTTAEIAYKVGFNSPSYFHKCFHDHYGYPPSEAKEQVINRQDEQNIKGKSKHISKSSKQKSRIYGIVAITTVLILVAYWSFYNFTKKENSSAVEKSIAVLPFENLSEDKENQHFADGLVDDLLSRLATINDFKVISRTSSDTYRERGTKKVPEIASELGVSYILEGSVRRYDNKVRITAQLIDAKRDDHVWSKSFDRDLADIFELQSEIAIQVASGLKTALTEQVVFDIQKNHTENVKAFELYQLGRFHWNKRTPEGFKTSINYFENAIAIDSSYGLAYAGLADTYNLMAILGLIEMSNGRNESVKLAKKALELDPSLAQAHNVLASIYTYVDWNWELAENEYLEAIKLNQNYSTAYHYYSEHLSIVGRHDEARKMIDKAIELDPLSFIIRIVSAKLYMGQGEFKKALEENMRSEELQKDHPVTFGQRFLIHYYNHEYSKAFESLKNYIKALNFKLPLEFELSYSKVKIEQLINWTIENQINDYQGLVENQFNKFHMAILYSILGDNEKVLNILEEQIGKAGMRPEFTFDYAFRNLHSNPRFQALLAKMDLPPTPEVNN